MNQARWGTNQAVEARPGFPGTDGREESSSPSLFPLCASHSTQPPGRVMMKGVPSKDPCEQAERGVRLIF